MQNGESILRLNDVSLLQSVSDEWRLTINVYVPIYGFLMVWLQISTEQLFTLFHHSCFDYICFTVMFHICVTKIPVRIEHILVIWSYIRIKDEVSRAT